MPYPRSLPDSGTIRQLHRKHTYAEIAKMYGVSEQAVYQRVRHDSPRDITPLSRHQDFVPWRVKLQHTWTSPAKNLRMLARRAAGHSIGDRERYVDNWLAKLREMGVVLDYDPDYPPNPASPTYGGFFYVERTPEDGDLPVRRPKDPDSADTSASA